MHNEYICIQRYYKLYTYTTLLYVFGRHANSVRIVFIFINCSYLFRFDALRDVNQGQNHCSHAPDHGELTQLNWRSDERGCEKKCLRTRSVNYSRASNNTICRPVGIDIVIFAMRTR